MFLGLFQDLKRPGEELFEAYSMEEMAFVPAVKPPPSKRAATAGKRLKSTPVILNFDLASLTCPDNMDFFTSTQTG
jgi:hypothetical protein